MKKILVVDNDKFILEFMNDVLSERGHEVVTAEGGLSALDILKTYTPDIIFVDLVMPNIEGKQLCKIIRSMPELRDVFIVILSAIAAEEDFKIKESRADACIAKGPVNDMAKHVLAMVDRPDLTPTKELPGETIGVQGIFPRNITKELLSVKNHFQIILGKISEGVLEVTSGGRIIYTNSIALSIIGIPEEKLLGSNFIDLFSAEDRHRVAELVESSGDKPQITIGEFFFGLTRRKVTLQFLPFVEYSPTSLVIINDLTEVKRAEGALRESEQKFRVLAENQHDVVWTVNENLEVDYISPSCYKMTGTTAEEIMGGHPKDFYTEESYQRVVMRLAEETQKAANEIQPGVLEVDQYHKDGHLFPVEITCMPIFIDNRLVGVQGITRDITERKKAEEALRESEDKFRSFSEQSLVGIYLISDDVFKYVNPKFAEIFGYSVDECLDNMYFRQLVHPEDLVKVQKQVGRRLSGETKAVRYSFRGIKKSGETIHVEIFGSSMVLKGKTVATGTMLDITDHKQAEGALRESEEKYRSMMESMKDPIYICSQDFRVEYMNPSMIQRTGRDATGEFCFKALHDLEEKCPWCMHYKTQQGECFESETVSPKDNRAYQISSSPIVHGDGSISKMTVFRDTTDLKKLETQLQQTQKMEAMGLMAGGVAHDLNNILSGIVSYPELLLMNLSEDSPLRKPLKTIQESGMRAADVVEDLMTIARGVASSKNVLNLNTMVEGYLESAEHQKLESIQSFVNFKTELAPDLLNISGSPTHIKKILMNLVTNASEAIEGSGTVTISTVNQYLDEPLRGYEAVRTGEYVMLTVSDNGSGISLGDLEKIFEPFYTKKVMGRSGTGLGLAVVWNTVQDHKGYINVKNSEKGTAFELYLPVNREEVAAEGQKIPMEDYLGHGEKILVVDDEERQREIATGMLTELGYNTESVSSGEEAIEYVKEHPVDLIVLDMVMPKGINGRKTYEEIIKIRPGQKAIIASGFSESEEVKMAQKSGASQYIKKPYILEKIGVAIKEELEK
jgi:two-component system, cell cycle sensor histidine kinase and response regulator CckA